MLRILTSGLTLLCAASAWCATIPITVVGTTPTQGVVTYKPTITGACTVALSEASGYTPLVNDANPSLFTNASSDLRPGDLTASGTRTVVLGRRRYELALDGKRYSRALQANTPHYLQVTCGSDVGTATFTTANIPLGAAPDVPGFDSGAFGNYAQPTIDFQNPDLTYVDALSGVLLKRATSPYNSLDVSATNQNIAAVYDPTSAWTTPSNILGSSGFATYAGSGTTSAYLFLAANITVSGQRGYSQEINVVDAKFHLNGSGTDATAANRTLSACVTQDHGQTCQGATIDLPALPQTTPSIVSFPSGYPDVIFKDWTSATGTPISSPTLVERSGNVTISGTALTLNSGDTFQDLVAGDIITVPGSGCPNSDQCVIVAVVNANALTLATSASITANYTASNFGWKIWKKTATGSISVNTAQYDYAIAAVLQMPAAGAYSQCSRINAPTTIDRNGTPLGYTQNGNLCVQLEDFGNAHLYWIGTNGESRFISSLVRPAVVSPAQDTTSIAYMCPQAGGSPQLSPFDQTDANSLYCVGTKTGGLYEVVYKCTYDPTNVTWGNYKEFTDYTASLSNPAEVCTNVTKASLGQDLNTQGVPSGYDIASGNTSGPYMAFAPLIAQGGIAYYVRFNVNTNQVEFIHDSWTGSGAGGPRWGTLHGTAGIEVGYGALFIAPMRNQSALADGQYQIPMTAIAGLGNTALTDSYTDAQTCEQLGVTNPTFIAQGATGNKCISITVTGEPYNPAPNAYDLSVFPWPHNSTACGGDNTTANCWAQLQISQEGDFITDITDNGSGQNNGFYEQMRLVKKVNSTTWILQRGASQADCTVTQMVTHVNGWVPIMQPAGLCNAVSYYWNTTTNASSFDAASMNTAHNDLLTDGVSNSGTFAQCGYNIRTGTLSSQIGQPATYNSFGAYSPTFAGSAASVQTLDLQCHPSARQFNAPPNEFRWILDGRPYGGALGGSTALFYHVIATTGTTNVYKVAPPTTGPGGTGSLISSLDRKNLPMQVWAGRNLLKDKSGPGSVLAAGDSWNYCVADFAGECIGGSSSGDVFMNVPQAYTGGSGLCQSQFEVNTPCWVSAAPVAPFVTQVGIDKPDATGVYWRRISNYFNGIGWTDNFWNARSLPGAGWAFSNARWLNGVRTEIMIAKLPPWPAVDAVQRNTFVPVTIKLTTSSSKMFKIRFGYDTNLYCTTRLEQCATQASTAAPFQWVSEGNAGTVCNGACTLSIPALAGRVLYYVVDNVSDGTSWPMQAVGVN